MKTSTLACIAAAGLATMSSATLAASTDTQETRFYIAPMASFSLPNDATHRMPTTIAPSKFIRDDDNGWQLSFGKNFGDYFALELYAFTFNDIDVGGPAVGGAQLYGTNANLDVTGYGASALFFPARDILPIYAVVGAGIGDYDFDSVANPAGFSYDSSDFYDVGAGFMVPLNDYGVALRAEYRYRSTDVETSDGGEEYFRGDIISVGVQIPLGAPAQAPQPEQTPEPIGPIDSDGDGVIDANDQCPGTPSGVQVNAVGCPIAKEAPVVLRGVTFEFDSAKLTTQAESRLNNVTAALDASPDVRFRIEGHTDSIGTKAYNQDLSERRAGSVRDYLVTHGIGTDRITDVAGYGETRPVATNETAAGRAQNRRVELDVVQQ